MATITRSISSRKNNLNKSEILLRVSISAKKTIRVKSGVFVDAERFKNGKLTAPRFGQDAHDDFVEATKKLRDVESAILDYCNLYHNLSTKEGIYRAIDDVLCPLKLSANITLFQATEEYVKYKGLAPTTTNVYKVVGSKLKCFNDYVKITTRRKSDLMLIDYDATMIRKLFNYVQNEVDILERFPQLKQHYRRVHQVKGCGRNFIATMANRLSAVFRWSVKRGLLAKSPFNEIELPTESYGTPYYLTLEERNTIADFEITDRTLDAVRDLFVFQCLIGCRSSDLMRLTAKSFVNGAIEYVPQKTRSHTYKMVRVPLNDRALKIVAKYEYLHAIGKLLPEMNVTRINRNLKRLFALCGIVREVTIINPLTGIEEQRPINEVASTHLARRTFIGNLYKQVKDPNLIGVLSGHVQGSKSFERYRTIDEDMKKEIIDLIK